MPPDQIPAAEVAGRGPLSGVNVLEYASDDCPLAVSLALAFAGRVAADLGASVTVVQGPASARRRTTAPLVEGESVLSLFLDAGKSFVSEPEVASHLAGAQVVLADDGAHRAHAAEAENAVWTLVSMRGAAAGARPDSEFTVLAATGLLDLVGDPDRKPLRLGGRQLAYAAGLAAYMGFSAALSARAQGGDTGPVRVNLADVGVWLNWKSVAMSTWGARVATRLGQGAEWRTVRCKDGWTAVVYLEADWPVLRDLIEDPRLNDPRFDDRGVRRANAAFITGAIEDFFMGMTRAELRDLALAKRIPLGPVWSPAELERDPQYAERGFLRRSGSPPVLRPAAPVVWNGRRFGGEVAS